MPVTRAGGGALRPGSAGVGRGVDEAARHDRREFRAVAGDGGGLPVALVSAQIRPRLLPHVITWRRLCYLRQRATHHNKRC
ncbi:hypothetical protein LCH21_04375 [Patescibacteria group bacterium]|nr:hypothetical protein [Patescibacteria group bacterium]